MEKEWADAAALPEKAPAPLRRLTLPLAALSLDVVSALCLLLLNLFIHRDIPAFIRVALLLAVPVAPVVGLALGVGALSMGRDYYGKWGWIVAIVAIVLPVVAVAAVVLAVATGALMIGM